MLGAISIILIHYFIQIFVAHAGKSTSTEAQNASKIISKALGKNRFEEKLKMELNFLLIQMQNRNRKIENIFFTIDWNFIRAVSEKIFDKFFD